MNSNRPLLVAVVILLVVSLVLNVYGLSRMSRLDDRIAQLQGYVSSQVAAVQSQVGGIYSALNDMEQADAWYSQPQFEVLGTNAACSNVRARVTWTFHELAAQAQVGLAFRFRDNEWRSADVENVGGGTYRADMTLPLAVEPLLRVTYAPASGAAPEPSRVEEAVVEEMSGSPSLLEYVIHATEDGTERASDPIQLNVAKLVGQFVARINEPQDNKLYSVSIQREAGPDCLQVTAGEVWLEDDTGHTVGRTPLEQDQVEAKTVWVATAKAADSGRPVKLFIKLTLSSGSEIERYIEVH